MTYGEGNEGSSLKIRVVGYSVSKETGAECVCSFT